MKNYVPMEFCVLVEGQVFPKEHLMEEETKMLKKFSLANPKDRQKTICRMVQDGDGPCGGEIIRNFGVEVNKNMTALAGRVIGPPELKVGGPNGRVIKISVDKEKCQWNLVGKGVVEGKPVKRWAVLDFSSDDKNRLNPGRFIPKLIAQCRNLGIHMEKHLILSTY
ncbi:hypothetical protein OIU84_007355 [Salix udensis]|uniref:Uncharacterized protein n=1 Tax=Salix udensis TaxID=889485 RepID=A0AAD6NZG5_9ROSI|nr:hypothetical protein OIU84_007355 [Salix udensis]